MAVASTGPATTGRPQRIGRQPAQQVVAAAAPDEVDDVRRRGRRAAPRRGPWRRTRPPGCRGSPARRAASSARGAPPPATTSAEIRAGHVARRQQRRVVGVERRAAGRPLGRGGQQGRQRRPGARPLPGADRLLEQPQAHDVAQEADPPVDAQLVREVGGPARLVADRRVELEARRGPRCRRRCRPTRSLASGTPTTADAVSCDPTCDDEDARRRARSRPRPPSRTGPSGVPGSRHRPEQRRGQPELAR